MNQSYTPLSPSAQRRADAYFADPSIESARETLPVELVAYLDTMTGEVFVVPIASILAGKQPCTPAQLDRCVWANVNVDVIANGTTGETMDPSVHDYEIDTWQDGGEGTSRPETMAYASLPAFVNHRVGVAVEAHIEDTRDEIVGRFLDY